MGYADGDVAFGIAYLLVVTPGGKAAQVDLLDKANLQAFQARVAAWPAVQKALRAEGLMPAVKAA